MPGPFVRCCWLLLLLWHTIPVLQCTRPQLFFLTDFVMWLKEIKNFFMLWLWCRRLCCCRCYFCCCWPAVAVYVSLICLRSFVVVIIYNLLFFFSTHLFSLLISSAFFVKFQFISDITSRWAIKFVSVDGGILAGVCFLKIFYFIFFYR